MAATRMQVYLTEQQRRRLDERQRRDGKSRAAVIREAIDAYLTEPSADPAGGFAETFGALPDLAVPARSEWQERESQQA